MPLFLPSVVTMKHKNQVEETPAISTDSKLEVSLLRIAA